MGQQQSTPEPHSARNYHFQSNTQVKNQFKSNKVKQHEGILKLRSTPFPNCVQISNDGMLLFLENAQATLYELLQTRLYTNQLFPLQDVERLIENIVYTLAFFQESNVTYRDLCQSNVYYCNGVFKLLPNELIEQTIYDRAWQNFYGLHQTPQQQQPIFPYLSPQLIIALRMKQKSINDTQILNKSNVFILGLILLEATTLLPSSQCYDMTNYDIFNNVITERLDLVQEHYNQCVARIVANMLDYDFNQRMDLRELSIWVNRELAANRNGGKSNFETEEKKIITLVPSKSTLSINKSRYMAQELEKQQQQQPAVQSIPAPTQETLPSRSYSRSNMVYIHGYEDSGKEDSRYSQSVKGAKNCIYLEALPQYQVDYQMDKKFDERHMVQPLDLKTKLPGLTSSTLPEPKNNPKAYNFNRYSYQRQDKYSKYVDQNQQVYNEEPKLARNYPDNSGYAAYVAPQSTLLREVANQRHKYLQEQRQIKKAADFAQTYKDQTLITSKLKGQNKYYPNLSQIQNAQRQIQSTKRISKHSQVSNKQPNIIKQCFDSKQSRQSRQSRQSDSKCSINDGSINRIKMEIQKSRKLIQEFRKTQGITQ